MAEETYSEQVEKAVLDSLTDVLPGPVIGFVGIATYLNAEGEQAYVLFNTPDAMLGESMGLARQVDLFYEDQYRRHLASFQGEDD